MPKTPSTETDSKQADSKQASQADGTQQPRAGRRPGWRERLSAPMSGTALATLMGSALIAGVVIGNRATPQAALVRADVTVYCREANTGEQSWEYQLNARGLTRNGQLATISARERELLRAPLEGTWGPTVTDARTAGPAYPQDIGSQPADCLILRHAPGDRGFKGQLLSSPPPADWWLILKGELPQP